MAEPRIQYAKTKDGVNIAYSTLGEGMPLVWLSPFLWSHLEVEWKNPATRRARQSLAQKRLLIRFDGRGSGLSDRGVSSLTLSDLVLDLEAVVDRLNVERFALMSMFFSGPVAISYTNQHPERVSHLILLDSWDGRPEVPYSPQYEATRTLAGKDWELFTETAGHVLAGWRESEQASWLAGLIRESVTPEAYQAYHDARANFDVRDLLPGVGCPTLVLHRRRIRWTLDVARDLASQITGARLVLLEGSSEDPFDMASMVRAIDEFLDEGEEAVPSAKQPAGGHIHTILFTDIEGSTALTERLGDARAQELRRAHDTIVREALKGCGGSETKHTGDGIMASFPSASRAIECAVAVQRAIAGRGDEMLRVRIGLNAGEPVAEEADLFGTAVNLARRICDDAEPGQILVSDVVHQLAAGKGFTFADNGEATLKGFEKPVRLHEVKWVE